MSNQSKAASNPSSVVVEVELAEQMKLVPLVVHRLADGNYEIQVDGRVRHAPCSPEDVMRALGNYLNSVSYRVNEKPKPIVP